MRAIKLDSFMTTVDVVDLDIADLDAEIRRIVGGPFNKMPGGDDHLFLVQKDQSNSETPGFVMGGSQSILGTALLIGKDVVGFSDVKVSAEDVADRVVWIDSEVIF